MDRISAGRQIIRPEKNRYRPSLNYMIFLPYFWRIFGVVPERPLGALHLDGDDDGVELGVQRLEQHQAGQRQRTQPETEPVS